MTTRFDDVTAVKPYAPTHKPIIMRLTCEGEEHVPRSLNGFAPRFPQLRVSGLFGFPLRRRTLDSVVNTFRRLLITVIFSGQLIHFEWHAVTAIVDVAVHLFPPYSLDTGSPRCLPRDKFQPSRFLPAAYLSGIRRGGTFVGTRVRSAEFFSTCSA
jgi:hypothetical protein